MNQTKVFFCTVNFAVAVYAMGSGLGFTTQIYKYVRAENVQQAVDVATKYYTAKGTAVASVSARHCARALRGTMPGTLLYSDAALQASIEQDDQLMSDWFRNVERSYDRGFQTDEFQQAYPELHDFMRGMHEMTVIS